MHYTTDDARAARCHELTAELHEWLAGRTAPAFDDTIASLIDAYQRELALPCYKIRENTRPNYEHSGTSADAPCGEGSTT